MTVKEERDYYLSVIKRANQIVISKRWNRSIGSCGWWLREDLKQMLGTAINTSGLKEHLDAIQEKDLP